MKIRKPSSKRGQDPKRLRATPQEINRCDTVLTSAKFFRLYVVLFIKDGGDIVDLMIAGAFLASLIIAQFSPDRTKRDHDLF